MQDTVLLFAINIISSYSRESIIFGILSNTSSVLPTNILIMTQHITGYYTIFLKAPKVNFFSTTVWWNGESHSLLTRQAADTGEMGDKMFRIQCNRNTGWGEPETAEITCFRVNAKHRLLICEERLMARSCWVTKLWRKQVSHRPSFWIPHTYDF